MTPDHIWERVLDHALALGDGDLAALYADVTGRPPHETMDHMDMAVEVADLIGEDHAAEILG